MRTLRQLGVAIAVALAIAVSAPPAAAFAPPGGRIVIAESGGAAGKIDRSRVSTIVERLCAEFHLDKAAVPEIVFIHLSDDEARAGGVPVASTVMVERSLLSVEPKRADQPERFLVWMVGDPDDSKLVGAVAHILRLHSRLDISDADLLNAEKRIVRRMSATVSVNAFVK